MRLDFSGERLLAMVAHPDDAELLCAGTLARAKRDGAAIGIAVLCRGDKGQPLKPVENLAAVRLSEMTDSAQILGAELLRGDIPDGELYDGPEHRLVAIELLRQFAPTLVLSHSPDDYHPDHRAAGQLAEAATWFACSPGHVTAHPTLAAHPALWWLDTIDMHAFTPEFFVDVTAFAELKTQMLACHRSQLQRGADADFAPLAELMRRQQAARGAQAGVAAAEAFRTHRVWKRTAAW